MSDFPYYNKKMMFVLSRIEIIKPIKMELRINFKIIFKIKI